MTTILIKKKDTAGAPAPGDLTNAAGGTEIAVNTATKRIYTKDAGGNVVELGTNPSVITGNLLFSPDNTYDIGASGTSRPRSLFLGTNITVGSLTSTRVPYASTGGLLIDSASLTFNGTTLTSGGFTTTGTTATGALDVNSTTDSSSVSTGAAVVDGGLGLAKSLFVGGNITVTKNTANSFIRLQSLAPYSFPGDYTISAGGQSTPGMTIIDNTASLERLTFVSDLTVFNEGGANIDFRVESDGSPNMFFVDASTNRIGINTNSPAAIVHIESAADGFMRFDDSRTAISGSFDSFISWYSYATANPVANVGINHNDFFGSTRKFFIKYSGDGPTAVQTRLEMVTTETVFNQDSQDVDFRVESDTNTHMLFVDAGTDTVNIGGTPPTYPGKLNVGGGGIFSNATSFDPDLADNGTILLGNINDGGGFSAPGVGWKNSGTGNTAAVVAAGNTLYLGTGNASTANSLTARLALSHVESVFNEGGLDVDFRVESDNRTNMLFVDAGLDQVCMGTSTPRANATLTVGYVGVSPSFNAQISIDANQSSGTGQAVLELLAGSSGTNRASRVNFLNGATSTTNPRWTLINDFDQNGTNDFRLVNAASQSVMLFTQSGGVVFNEDSLDYDFRVESDTSTHALFVDAGTDTVNINTSSPNNGAKLNVYAASGINQVNWGVNGNSQGNPQFARVVRWVSSAGNSNKLVLPFLSQGSLNSTTVCRVMGHNAQFNTNSPLGFDFTFAVGHLSTLANLAVWGTGGNYSSIAINGMNVEVTFTSAYSATGGQAGGMFITLEYMCNNLLYSIQPNSITMA